jgi:hypothetical protein
MENKEKLELTAEEVREIVYNGLDTFDVVYDKIITNTRWSIVHEIVIKRLSDNKYFMDTYSIGATERQDGSPFEYVDPNFIEVFPIEKTIIVYE